MNLKVSAADQEINLQSFDLFHALHCVIDGIKLSVTTPFYSNLLLSTSANDRPGASYIEAIREIHFPQAAFLSPAEFLGENAMEWLQ